MLTLTPIPALKDNYIWALDDGHQALLIDPGDAQPAHAWLMQRGLSLHTVLCTHHHADHIGGIARLRQLWPDALGFGPAGSALAALGMHAVREEDCVSALGLSFRVLEMPGHTLDHIVFYAAPYLFCGDTLFGAGCGRLFEGSAADLFQNIQRIAALPDDTWICCAHEYTVANIQFALMVEPDNQALRARDARDRQHRAHGKATLPSTLSEERATNPFLRTDQPAVCAAIARFDPHVAVEDAVGRLGALRRWKDQP